MWKYSRFVKKKYCTISFDILYIYGTLSFCSRVWQFKSNGQHRHGHNCQSHGSARLWFGNSGQDVAQDYYTQCFHRLAFSFFSSEFFIVCSLVSETLLWYCGQFEEIALCLMFRFRFSWMAAYTCRRLCRPKRCKEVCHKSAEGWLYPSHCQQAHVLRAVLLCIWRPVWR